MKVCPKCGQSFNDESLKFCLLDGAALEPGDSAPTVVMPDTRSAPPSAEKKKRNPLVWALVALAILVLGGAALAGLLFYAYRLGSESGRTDRATINTSSSPRTVASPRSGATSTPASSPATSSSPDVSDADGSEDDEATPIKWTTSAVEFKQETGRTYKFHCPPDGTEAIVWGTDVYATGSSICTAAVHAGKITLKDGGDITIEYRPGRQTYGSTVRNGITSNTFGEYSHSFIIR